LPNTIVLHVLQKVTSPFREFGLGVGFLYAVDRVLSRMSARLRLHAYEFMVQPIGDKPLMARRSKLDVREIGLDDPEIALMPVRPEVMQARRRQSATCVGAFDKGELVGYMWFCHGTYDEDEVRCTYVLVDRECSVFDFDFFIFPERRMGTAFLALWDGASRLMYARGVRYSFSRLTRFNVASKRAHDHFGWKSAGRALFLQLGRLEMMFATIFPFVQASVSGRVRVNLRPDALRISPSNQPVEGHSAGH
jgi:hypothetical protein